jgi:hypothetical protein
MPRTDGEIEHLMDEWHDLDDESWEALGEPEVWEYLGWTEREYAIWVETGRIPA